MGTLSWRALRLLFGYTAAIVIVLGIVEAITRLGGGPPGRLWYPSAIEQAAGQPLGLLFVGSSRVQAAIDTSRVAAARPGNDTRLVFNAGQGFSTVIEHALGLRRLANRGLLRGTTVFIEAPGGIPDDSRWSDRWYYQEMPDFLLSVMEEGDLRALWRSQMSQEDKIAASIRGTFRSSQIVTYHELMRVRFLSWVDRRYRAVASGPALPVTPLELRAAGGVRTDLDDRNRIRLEATLEGDRMVREQLPVTDWDARVVGTIVETVRRGGGTVVFFETPLSGPMRRASETPVGLENRRRFLAQTAAWGLRMIPLGHTFPDDDFPDVWHLSARASSVFTDELMAAWQRSRR